MGKDRPQGNASRRVESAKRAARQSEWVQSSFTIPPSPEVRSGPKGSDARPVDFRHFDVPCELPSRMERVEEGVGCVLQALSPQTASRGDDMAPGTSEEGSPALPPTHRRRKPPRGGVDAPSVA